MRRCVIGVLCVALVGAVLALASPAQAAVPSGVSFGKSTLRTNGLVQISRPTSIDFGPDGKIYVAEQYGRILRLTVTRSGSNVYDVTAAQAINTIVSALPNHNDDGSLAVAADFGNSAPFPSRQITGLLTAGTSAAPILYVSSSDPRIGGGKNASDTGLDTNSGVISRLSLVGGAWQHQAVVRGLSRSAENHSVNGMALSPNGSTLYVTVGGNTNMGAPSNNFVDLPEYATSAAIISVDLAAIAGSGGSYDLPTLDDEDQPGADTTDPFGGNSGKNQAVLTPGGPVQVYSPGWRNPYDVVITEKGQMFSVDNGANSGWGDQPKQEGPGGNCTNEVSEPGGSTRDSLHRVTPGFYRGHPNPARGNTANKFNVSNPQSAVSVANPVECDFRTPGAGDGALATFGPSTNGLTEYTATNFDGALQGDLLAAAYNNTVFHLDLDAAGTGLATPATTIFSSVGGVPLDINAMGDADIFPGTIWVTDVATGGIVIFEPGDYGGGSTGTCSGSDTGSIDEDADGFDNADEIDNGTDPCSAADFPADADGDQESDLNDIDDDNDGVVDSLDHFARDPANGRSTSIPHELSFDNVGPGAGGLLSVGFTGLLSNHTSDYQSLYDPENLIPGGAAGSFTIESVANGDAKKSINSLRDGFQFGVDTAAITSPVVAYTRVLGPFLGYEPTNFRQMGIQIGTGSQDQYLKLVVSPNGGVGGLEVATETSAQSFSSVTTNDSSVVGADAVDLELQLDPVTATVTPRYRVVRDGVEGAFNTLAPTAIPREWYTTGDNGAGGSAGLAVGLFTTSFKAQPFAATWDAIGIRYDTTSPPPPPGPGAAATVTIQRPGSQGITGGSTYTPGAFQVQNNSTGGQEITGVTVDSRTALFPDLAFDPADGTPAGDPVGKCLTADSGATETGYVPPANACVTPFGAPLDNGYQTATLAWNDFESGETFTFSADMDPTSIQGLPQGPAGRDYGGVSGLELLGSTITVEFSDGTTLSGRTWRNGTSPIGSRAVLDSIVAPAPSILAVGVATPDASVASASQTVRVAGTPGAAVRVLVVEGALWDGTFDIDPFEANSAVALSQSSATVGSGGTVDVPVTLLNTDPDGGNNHIVAVELEADGTPGAPSNRLRLQLGDDDPPPTIQPGVVAIVEGDSGTSTVDVPVRLSSASANEVTVQWSTVDSQQQVVPGVDFESASGTLTFAPGETEASIPITVIGDTVDEPGQFYGAEWGLVELTNPVNGQFGSGFFGRLASFLIIDDD